MSVLAFLWGPDDENPEEERTRKSLTANPYINSCLNLLRDLRLVNQGFIQQHTRYTMASMMEQSNDSKDELWRKIFTFFFLQYERSWPYIVLYFMLVYARQRYISSTPIHNSLRKNLNYYEYVSLMIPIFLLEDQETMSRDISPSTTLALTLFVSSVLTGFYIYDLIRKNKSTEDRLMELEHVVHETATEQESQLDTLHEYDERIREKKDYDETEEVEENKYQAWSGFLQDSKIALTFTIWREKYSTVKKNQEWTEWDRTTDGACVVRDFYLGNSNPDFSWTVRSTSEETIQAEMSDTLINGWDSVCKIKLLLSASKQDLLSFVSQQDLEGSKTFNLAVKKSVDEGLIQWSRILLDA